MDMPVMASTPVKSPRYVGCCWLWKSPAMRANFSGGALDMRGRSHAIWLPAWRTTPNTMAHAMICKVEIVLCYQVVLEPNYLQTIYKSQRRDKLKTFLFTLWKYKLSSKGTKTLALVDRSHVNTFRHTGKSTSAMFSFRVSPAPFAVVRQYPIT